MEKRDFNFDKKGVKGDNFAHLFFAIVLIVGLVYLVTIGLVTAITVSSPNFTRVGNYSGAINFSITVLSTQTNVSNITIWYNASGGANATFLVNIPNATFTTNSKFNISHDISGLADGDNYNFSFFVFNSTGAGGPAITEVYSSTNITIDNTPPNVTFSGEATSGGNYSNSAYGLLQVNVSVSDNNASIGLGVGEVWINISNASNSQHNFTRARSSAGSVWNITATGINLLGYADGVWTIRVYANDSLTAGDLVNNHFTNITANLNTTEKINITIDNTAPTASAVCSPGTVNTGDVVTCTCSPSDSLSGVNSSATSITATPSTSNTGTFTESCSFADMAGNIVSTTAQYTVEQSGSGASTSSGSSSGAQVAVTSTDDSASIEKSYTFTTITPGTSAVKSDFNADAGINEIALEVSEAATNVMVTVTEHDGKPSAVSVAKNGEIYKYLQIETENLDGKLEKATIKVQVEKSWVSSNVQDMNDVAVFKFDGSDWNELSTTYDSEDDTYYYYIVSVDSFSYFAIGEKVVEEATTTSTPSIPEGSNKFMWITIAIILLAIIIGGGIAWKKKGGQ